MRIILDTNVIVSALIQKSYPFFILDRILSDMTLEVCISEPLFGEYIEVLNRTKFSRFTDFHTIAQTLLGIIESKSLKFMPTVSVSLITDNADNRLLELAETSKADYLVTGNTKDFTMRQYKGTKIISPKNFFELINL